MSNLTKLYTPDVIRITEFLSESNKGLFIPAFQRPYTWDKENSGRVFEDMLLFIRYLFNHGDHDKISEEFQILGTVLMIQENVNTFPIDSESKKYLPNRVMSVVDGQQRLTTFVLINLILHDILNYLYYDIDIDNCNALNEGDDKHNLFKDFINENYNELNKELRNNIYIEKISGHEHFRLYPKIIRSSDDVWSFSEKYAKYTSPIAKILHEYNLHINNKDNKKYWGMKNSKEWIKNNDKYKNILAYYKEIEKHINKIIDREEKNNSIPDINRIFNNNSFLRAINFYLSENDLKSIMHVINYLEKYNYDKYEKLDQLITLLILIKYINEKVIINTLTVKNESSAFDLFESINTTGELLTSFETLVPKVIEAESVNNYEKSLSRVYIDNIDYYIQKHSSKAIEKQNITSELITLFALSESGEILSKNLRQQRNYLLNRYCNELTSIEEKRDFLKRLNYFAELLDNLWYSKERNYEYLGFEYDEVPEDIKVGFQVIRELKHEVILAPLHRFISYYNENKNKKTKNNIIECLKYSIGLSFLWRGAYGGTNRIDNLYRQVLRNKKYKKLSLAYKINKIPKCEDMLVNIFTSLHGIGKSENLTDKNTWKDKVRSIENYYRYPKIARFLIFLAYHKSEINKENGLIIKKNNNNKPLLVMQKWNYKENELEHVAPQNINLNKTNDWDPEIYKPVSDEGRLGNLVVIEQQLNILLSDHNWEIKKLIYKYIALSNEEKPNENNKESDDKKDDITSISAKLEELKINIHTLNDIAEKIKNSDANFEIYQSVAYSKDWDVNTIIDHTYNIAEYCWIDLTSKYLPIEDIRKQAMDLINKSKN